ncbi:hypothetical protein PCE1_002679 [Barthelona sp. PCE]
MFKNQIVVDCKGAVLGRLASYIAKELLNGQKVVLVRCEEAVQTGSFMRNKLKFLKYLRKHMRTNCRHGFYHHRSPSGIFTKTIRGMVPHTTKRGAAAMGRLQCFEGVPPQFDAVKRMVVPDALKITRLDRTHKVTVLKRLSSEVGWKYGEIIEKLEEKRKHRSAARYAVRKANARTRQTAEQAIDN